MELFIGKAGDADFVIDAQELVTGRTCIIAQSGAGKSWSIAVLCERLCENHIGYCLIDTEGEYFSLRDKFQVLWVGTDNQCDFDIETVNLRDVMTQAIKCGTAVIYDVSETDMQERVSKLANVLYDIESQLRIPYLLIVEEADKFIPQSRESIKKIEEISRRGRKRGLGLLVATQRPALVTKNVLSQCNSQIIGKLSIENDLKAVDLFFSSRKELEELASLNPGEFFVMGKIVREKTKMRFGSRKTKHRGLTPQLDTRPKPAPEVRPVQETESCEEPILLETGDIRSGEKAVVALLHRRDALENAQKNRKKRLFAIRDEERITAVDLVYLPLIHVGIKYLGGLLQKSTRTASFLIEGRDGCCAEVHRGLVFRSCFNDLIGLDEETIQVLTNLPKSGATETDLEAQTRLSGPVVKKGLKDLSERNLVTTSGKVANSLLYVPLMTHKIPKLPRTKTEIDLPFEPLKGAFREPIIEKDDFRKVLKGLEPTVEIKAFDTVYYPVFEIALVSGHRKRTIMIDAVTGNVIPKKS